MPMPIIATKTEPAVTEHIRACVQAENDIRIAEKAEKKKAKKVCRTHAIPVA
jgi:hypothetical protein